MYDHDPAAAAAYADAAVAKMRALGVPATPENYEVWYAYVARSDADLVRAIDVLLTNRQTINSDRMAELRELHHGRSEAEAARLAEIGERLAGALASADDQVAGAGRDAGAFSGRIESLAAAAEAGPDGAAAARLMAKEARELARRSRAVSSHLGRSRRTIETLRANLAEMRDAAETDALTGLPNRRVMERALREAAAEAMEAGTEACVAMIDVDHFKGFNDQHGHLMGDHVLRLVARLLREGVRERDVVARYGGEEFAVILPASGLTEARAAIDRIRERIAGRNLTNRKTGDVVGRVTFSAGVACYAYGETMEALVRRADQALYAAKHGGRNRVVAETEDREMLVAR